MYATWDFIDVVWKSVFGEFLAFDGFVCFLLENGDAVKRLATVINITTRFDQFIHISILISLSSSYRTSFGTTHERIFLFGICRIQQFDRPNIVDDGNWAFVVLMPHLGISTQLLHGNKVLL